MSGASMATTHHGFRRWALLAVLSGNMLIDALEVATVMVAMPSASRSLHVPAANASLLVIGFAAGFGGFILPGRILTARTGRRSAYLGALLVFAAASVAGACAVDEPMLVASRVLKGMCVGLTAPTGLAIISSTFPEGPARTRALSLYALFGASGFSAGLVASGLLTAAGGWRCALLFSGPLALALFPAGLKLIPREDADRPAYGLGPPPAPPDGATVSLARWPLVAAATGAAALNGSYWGFLFVAVFRMRDAFGWDPLTTGLALVATSLPAALTTTLAGRAAARIGPSRLIAAGSAAAFAGFGWFISGRGHPSYLTLVLPATGLVGAGYALSFAALHQRAVAGAPAALIGRITGVYQTSVQIGGCAALGLVAFAFGPDSGPRTVLVIAAVGLVMALADLIITRNESKERHGHSRGPGRRNHRQQASGPARAQPGALAAPPDEPAQ